MKEVKRYDLSILKLSKQDAIKFKKSILPSLSEIIEIEAKHGDVNTLADLLELLLIFDQMYN